MKRIFLLLLVMTMLQIQATFTQSFPAIEWEENNNAFNEGWGTEGFQKFGRYLLDSTHITGLLIVHKGKVIGNYVDIKQNSYVASCRKSILAMLYGPYVKSGKIDLSKTLEELEMDDIGGLKDIEKQASISDIISARSGVFHKASNAGDFLDSAPERGSVKPGSYWLYSNWDFNIAGNFFEQETGENVYDTLEKNFAIPLQMQDWDRSLQQSIGNTTHSKYKAHHMWFSTRDLARLGLLMLNKGKWNEEQIIDESWVKEITSIKTTKKEINMNVPFLKEMNNQFSYGFMWWLWGNQKDKRFNGAYAALGALGQAIAVFPEIDVVVAFKTNDLYQRSNSPSIRYKVL